jgi:hypothetical protein
MASNVERTAPEQTGNSPQLSSSAADLQANIPNQGPAQADNDAALITCAAVRRAEIRREILFGMPNKKPKRHRVTKAGLASRREALLEIIRAAQPASVRQTFYLASVRGLVAKDEGGYSRVQIDLVEMRRSGQLPYGLIVDHTRWQRKPVTFDSIDEALTDTAAIYRKALWRDVDSYIEIWLEKDALSGVVYPVTKKFDVPLMVTRGYASETFLHASGDYMAEVEKPCFVYHFGDFDPSGQDAARAVEKGLRQHAGGAEIHFERVAVTPPQIDDWSLPTRPTKQSDSRAKKFGPVSVELDAIDPNKLRELVEEVITRHLPPDQYRILIEAEKSERKVFQGLAGLVKQLAQRNAPDGGDAP